MTTCSPVLFLVFNRPDTTQRVFESIRAARPLRLYVAADGPRAGRAGESERCEAVRRIATAVDWPCELITLMRSENLGCKLAVSSAITWFFEREPEGIILEDDCLPSEDFFGFSDSLLERYRNNNRICAISGTQFDSLTSSPVDYYFSKYPLMWGWATWRRSWDGYRVHIPETEIEAFFEKRAKEQLNLLARLYWKRQVLRTVRGEIDTWDYQWIYHCMSHERLCIRPSKNIVANIGFGADATHTHQEAIPAARLIHHKIDTVAMRGPATEAVDKRLDSLDEKLWLRLFPRSIFVLLFPKLHGLIRHPISTLSRWLTKP